MTDRFPMLRLLLVMATCGMGCLDSADMPDGSVACSPGQACDDGGQSSEDASDAAVGDASDGWDAGIDATVDAGFDITPDVTSDVLDPPDVAADVGPDTWEPPVFTGAVKGQIVDSQGTPISGASVLACNASMCFSGDTQGDGFYHVDKLEDGAYKVQVMGSYLGFMNMAFPQEVSNGGLSEASRPIVFVDIVEEMVELSEEEGGTTILANGALEITASPDALNYPLGLAESLHAAPVPVEALPPYDVEPWVGAESGTIAFHLNPFSTEADPPLAFRVLTGAAPNVVYAVWSVEIKLGKLEHLGALTADQAGEIVSDGSVGLATLSTVVFIPE